MHILEFDCSVCLAKTGKASQRHGLKKGTELTAHEWWAQCLGCGQLCVQRVDDTRMKMLDLS